MFIKLIPYILIRINNNNLKTVIVNHQNHQINKQIIIKIRTLKKMRMKILIKEI